jgi:phage-related protein
MRISDGLEALWVPVRIFLLALVVSVFYVIVKVLKGVLESILEDHCVPIVRTPLLSIYYMD